MDQQTTTSGLNRPPVTVIIVNYNGAHYLPACLESLSAQTYPPEMVEVIVSDNGSSDDSLSLLAARYPWVKILAHRENLGFASGNNRAIREARGDYIALLNNDTAPSPDWLSQMISVAESDPRCGLVTGKIHLFYDQLPVDLVADAFQPLPDPRLLGLQLFAIETGTPGGVVQYLEGFYGWEEHYSGKKYRWCGDEARLGLPVPPGNGDWPVKLHLAAPRPAGSPASFQIRIGDQVLATGKVSGREPAEFVFKIPARYRALGQPLVQNAGSIIFSNGSGRDRGTFVRHHEVYYETDTGQYDRIEEVFAGCGANLLLTKPLLADVGLLDDDFFMYYEDTDLSWRARLKGWKVVYAPQGVIRHIHCGSSVEWSPFFLFHVERNRLAMVFKNGRWPQVFSTWGRFLFSLLARTLQGLPAALHSRKGYACFRAGLSLPYGIMINLGRQLPWLLRKRAAIQRNRRVAPQTLSTWFQKQEP